VLATATVVETGLNVGKTTLVAEELSLQHQKTPIVSETDLTATQANSELLIPTLLAERRWLMLIRHRRRHLPLMSLRHLHRAISTSETLLLLNTQHHDNMLTNLACK
jgi:hypothetical protein